VTPGLPLGLQPCNPFCLGRKPKVRVAIIMSYQMHARKKTKEEKPLELIVSCESQVLSIHD